MVSPASVSGRPAVVDRRQRRRRWRPIASIAATAVTSAMIGHQWASRSLLLQQSAHQNDAPRVDPLMPAPEPIRFIAVAGLYHSGTTGVWKSIKSNERVAAAKGIELKAYGMSDSGGYPPCGVALLPDSSVDMPKTMGNSSDIDGSNPQLYAKYGTLWGDWHAEGPKRLKGVLDMKPPHKQDAFYTWWKHTPPQHPVLACFRPDTLYVVLVRHPKMWHMGMNRKLYDIKYNQIQKQWILNRSDPRRLPPITLYFRSLFNVWEYYMRGFLSWEEVSAGENCYAQSDSARRRNCLGGANEIPASSRNIVLVRYEDYLLNPKKTLAQIFSFATRGLIDAEADEDKFIPYDEGKIRELKEILISLKNHAFFSVAANIREEAKEMAKLCTLLGYSCDESTALFIEN